MSEQEQIMVYKKMWLTPSLIILTRQGEQENILVACKMSTQINTATSETGCDMNGVICNSINES